MSYRNLLIVLAAVTFIDMTVVMALSPFFPNIAIELNTTVAALGQIQMVTYLTGAMLGLLIGPLADHYGLRRVMIASALLLALGNIATALATEYWVLLLSRIPAGLGVLGAVAMAVAATRFPQEKRRDGIGWVVGAMPFAAIIGTPALASIAHYTHWRMSFVVLGAICLLLAGLIWRSVPHDAPFPETKLHLGDVFRAYVPILGNRPLMLLYLSDVLRGVTWFGFLTYLAALAIQEYGLSLQQFGLLMFGGGSAYLVGTRLGIGRFPYMGLRTLLYSSISLMAISGALMFALVLSLPLFVALVLICGLMGGLSFTIQTIFISEASSGGQGTTMVLRKSGISASGAIGAGAGGALIAVGGFPLLGLGLGGFALLAAVSVLLATRASVPAPVEPAIGGE
jgi:MFS transporter, DHA1 family, inner membrane transport protein